MNELCTHNILMCFYSLWSICCDLFLHGCSCVDCWSKVLRATIILKMNPKPDLNPCEWGGFQPKTTAQLSNIWVWNNSTVHSRKTNLLLKSGAVSLFSRLWQANRFAWWQNNGETFHFCKNRPKAAWIGDLKWSLEGPYMKGSKTGKGHQCQLKRSHLAKRIWSFWGLCS